VSGLGDLSQTFDAHRGPILAAAAAGVVGVALWQRHKGATAPAGDTANVSAGGQTAGMNGAAAYDSSASDIYGLVQPQLESLGGQLTDLQNKLNNVPVAAPPVPPKSLGQPKIDWSKNPHLQVPVTPWAPPARTPVPVPAKKAAADSWVTVNAGDSLSKIAARYPSPSVTWQSIYNANRATIGPNPDLIHPGLRLHVVG
jgi:nucleoid-associated protein YgaU